MNKDHESQPEASLQKFDLVTAALCAFIVAVPLLYEGTTDQHRARVILASIPFLLLSFVGLRGSRPPSFFDRFSKFGVLTFFLGVFVSAIFAERSTIAWIRILELCWAGCMVFCVSCNIESRPRNIFYIISAIVFAYCISNARFYLAWMQTPGDPRTEDWTFAIPGYFHFRNLGFASAPALVALAWLPFCSQLQGLSGARKSLTLALLWIAAAVGWGVLGWSGSRAGVLSTLVGIGALAFFSKQRLSWVKLSSFSLSAGIVGAIASIPFTPLQGSSWGVMRIIGRATSVSEGGTVDEYSSGRITVWLDGLSRWSDNWLVGIGPDQYASQPGLPNRLLEPHNAFVDVALESGILGVFGFVLIIIFVVRLLKESSKSEGNSIVGSMILSYGMYSMIDGTLVWTLPLTYICVIMGALFGLNAKKREINTSKPSVERFVSIGVVSVTLLCIAVFYVVHLQSVWLSHSAPDSKSFAARSLYRFPATTWGVSSWLSDWEKNKEGDLDRWYGMLIDESPAPYFYRIEYAYYLIRKSRLAEARIQLERALEIAPVGVLPRLETMHRPVMRKLDEVLKRPS